MMPMARRRSKLDLYIQTINTLASGGPARLSRLTLKTKINCSPLRAILSDLVGKNIVEERKFKTGIFYAATPRARTVLSQYRDLIQMIPLA